MMDEEYRLTKKRITDELETDDTTVISKDVLMYGWDSSTSGKVRINVSSAGTLGVTL